MILREIVLLSCVTERSYVLLPNRRSALIVGAALEAEVLAHKSDNAVTFLKICELPQRGAWTTENLAMSAMIALVDDDRNILTSVSIALQAEGFTTRLYSDGEVALSAFAQHMPDLVISDIKMPKMDGLELLRQLRQKSDVPVIFLTSKDDELDEALGLALGADDYIAKPFSQRLLIARIKAVLRRSDARRKTPASENIDPAQSIMTRGDLVMDSARQRVTWKDKDISLTVTEFLILETLAQRPDVVKSRNQLMDVAYKDDIYVDDRTIDSHIKRLRRKFREVDPEFSAIDTLYGAGYRFSDGR